jgi:cleavage stimulation factor subunit 3
VTPIISPSQVRPKHLVHDSIEQQAEVVNSPITRLIDSINTNSPKRPFPADDFEDSQPRKLARGESPLKGAAGRRMNQRQVNGLAGAIPQGHPIPPPLPNQITYLLSIIPKSSTYVDTRFDAAKMVELLRETRLPPSITLQQREQQPPPPIPPTWQQQQFPPQQQPPPLIPPGYMPPPGMSQPQFGAGKSNHPHSMGGSSVLLPKRVR